MKGEEEGDSDPTTLPKLVNIYIVEGLHKVCLNEHLISRNFLFFAIWKKSLLGLLLYGQPIYLVSVLPLYRVIGRGQI